jgi:hypothetical protein
MSVPEMSEELRSYFVEKIGAGKTQQQIFAGLPIPLMLELRFASMLVGSSPRYVSDCLAALIAKTSFGGPCFFCETPIVGRPAGVYAGEIADSNGRSLHVGWGALCAECVKRAKTDPVMADEMYRLAEKMLNQYERGAGHA